MNGDKIFPEIGWWRVAKDIVRTVYKMENTAALDDIEYLWNFVKNLHFETLC